MNIGGTILCYITESMRAYVNGSQRGGSTKRVAANRRSRSSEVLIWQSDYY